MDTQPIANKFLIVSTFAPPAISGAPLMAYNLLRFFPADSFAILTSHVSLDERMIENGQKLPAKYFFFDTPTLTTAPQTRDGLFLKCKRWIRRFSALRSAFHFFSMLYLPFNAVRRGRKIMQQEKIELLLGYSDHGPALLSTYLLHRFTGKPFALHFYDLYCGNNFSWFFNSLARILEPKLFKHASRISVMSEALAEHYRNKYQREITVLHNAIPLDASSNPRPAPVHPEPFKIVYTGTIVWAQVDAIRNLVRAVQEISSPRVELHLYTPHKKEFLESWGIHESSRVIFAKGMPSEMPAIQAAADILFVGLSFETRFPLLINTSSPGKTCEYLASGRPILVHAPKESYIARYAKENSFAHVVDENSVEELKSGITKLITDPVYSNVLVTNAWKTVCSSHDAEETSARFRQFLRIPHEISADLATVPVKI